MFETGMVLASSKAKQTGTLDSNNCSYNADQMQSSYILRTIMNYEVYGFMSCCVQRRLPSFTSLWYSILSFSLSLDSSHS